MFRNRVLRAFTLIEVIVVLAIIAVLAGVAIPRMGASSPRYRIEAAARRVVADIELARQHANQTSSQQAIVFDAASNSYRLPGVTSLDDPSGTYSVELDEAPYDTLIIAVDFDGGAMLTFDGFGTLGGSGNGELWLTAGGLQRRIIVDLATGETSIE